MRCTCVREAVAGRVNLVKSKRLLLAESELSFGRSENNCLCCPCVGLWVHALSVRMRRGIRRDCKGLVAASISICIGGVVGWFWWEFVSSGVVCGAAVKCETAVLL